MSATSPTKYQLKLFITGRTARSESAVRTLERLCEQELQGQFELIIVDVLEQPAQAEQDRILATPTVVKELPPPPRRVIGDLSDKQKVLAGLDLRLAP